MCYIAYMINFCARMLTICNGIISLTSASSWANVNYTARSLILLNRMHRVKRSIKNTLWIASDRTDNARPDNVVNVVPRQMGMVVEEGGPYFHSGLTTCTHSSSRDLTLMPMQISMPMPIITSTSTITSTRYRLPGTLIASHPLITISRITITITITIIQITITIIVIITIIIIITTTTTIRFKSISISPEISVIETPVSVCKVTRKPESCFMECPSSLGLIYCALLLLVP